MSLRQTCHLTREPRAQARERYERTAATISAALPAAHVEHVGSTSVPGCIGKGDVDVLVRVAPEAFERSREVLDEVLVRSRRNEPTSSYVEYDHHEPEACAAVHLVAAGGSHDDFHRFKALLLDDPVVLQRYNALKRHYDGHPMRDYRRAKAHFIESLLAAGPGAR